MTAARATGLVVGYLADALLGDPARWHPVAGFGRVAGTLETRMYADSRRRGAAYALALGGGASIAGVLPARAVRGRPLAEATLTAAATWLALGGTTLDHEVAAVQRILDGGDLPAARQQVARLVGRETAELSRADVVRAAVESLAENTSDAVVAPLVSGAVAGVPGLLGYRAVNTLDAMVGHRSPRYRRFGWASARLDDLVNLPGSRLTALLAAAGAPLVGGSTRVALSVWRRDAGLHPSPNAGPVEAAFAGALGVTLGGVNSYGGQTEDRHTLGDGPPPESADLTRARRLARLAGGAALVGCGCAALVRGVGRRAATAAVRPAGQPGQSPEAARC